jgi:hypothetical protein
MISSDRQADDAARYRAKSCGFRGESALIVRREQCDGVRTTRCGERCEQPPKRDAASRASLRPLPAPQCSRPPMTDDACCPRRVAKRCARRHRSHQGAASCRSLAPSTSRWGTIRHAGCRRRPNRQRHRWVDRPSITRQNDGSAAGQTNGLLRDMTSLRTTLSISRRTPNAASGRSRGQALKDRHRSEQLEADFIREVDRMCVDNRDHLGAQID